MFATIARMEVLVPEDELALANGAFIWLQHCNDNSPPPQLSQTARDRITEVFCVEPDDLPAIRALIEEQNEKFATPLRMYLAGFEESVVRQLDESKVLNRAAAALSEAIREAKLSREPVPPIIVPQRKAAISGIHKVASASRKPRKKPEADPEATEVEVSNPQDEPKADTERASDLEVPLEQQDEKKQTNLLRWLQSATRRKPVEPSGPTIERLLVDFEADEEDLIILRGLINLQPVEHRDLLRQYLAGVSEDIIRKDDPENALNKVVFDFANTYREIKSVNREVVEDYASLGHEERDSDIDDATEQLKNVNLTVDGVKDWLKIIGRVPLLKAEQEVELSKAIEVGVLAGERLELDDSSMSETLKSELEYLIKQGEMAYDRMLTSNLRLVVSIAKRYTGRGMDFLDVIQEGNLGLIRAAQKFDYKKGYKFSTYATWWIRQAVTRALADQSRTIRIPVHAVETIGKIRGYERAFMQEHQREPTFAEIAEELDLLPGKVKDLKEQSRNPVSLHTPLGEDEGAELGDIIYDGNAKEVADMATMTAMVEALHAIMDTLSEREAGVVGMRFGIFDGQPKTLDEIGKVYGVTRERIRQIEAKTMSKMRHPSRSHLLRGYLH